MSYGADALLPTQDKMNPRHPEGHFCWWGTDDVLYIMKKVGGKRPSRIFHSGSGLSDYEIGTVHKAQHDQTGTGLGTYTVVGIVDAEGTHGEVPDRLMPHAVFK